MQKLELNVHANIANVVQRKLLSPVTKNGCVLGVVLKDQIRAAFAGSDNWGTYERNICCCRIHFDGHVESAVNKAR